MTEDASRVHFLESWYLLQQNNCSLYKDLTGENALIVWDTLIDMNISASTFSKPKLGTAGYGYCRPESTVENWVSWVFEVDGHEINVVWNKVVLPTKLQQQVGEMLIGLWLLDCWGNPLTDHENSTFEWCTVFRQQQPNLDPSIGSRIWAKKVRHLVSFDAIILISTTHDCYDCLSSSIHPRDRHWFTKYHIMGLVHKVLAGDAVLTSGLDGESSVVGEPFWRSFDAHDMTQEVRFLRRSLRELSEAVDAQAAAWVRVSTHHEHTFNYVWPVSLDWLSWPQAGRRDESSCLHCTSCSLPPSWISLRRFTIDVRISIDCWNSASTLWELDWKLSTPISSMADSVNIPGRRNVVPMCSFSDTMKCGNPSW